MLPVACAPHVTLPLSVLEAVRTALDEGRSVVVTGSQIWWSGETAACLAMLADAELLPGASSKERHHGPSAVYLSVGATAADGLARLADGVDCVPR